MCWLHWNSAMACEINVGQDLGDRGPILELRSPWVVMKQTRSDPSPPALLLKYWAGLNQTADECQPPAGEAIKNKQTDGRGRIDGGNGARRLPRPLTLIKQRLSQWKGLLEIDCIDFIAYSGKRHGGNYFLPITLFMCVLWAEGRHFSIYQTFVSERMSHAPKNLQPSMLSRTDP